MGKPTVQGRESTTSLHSPMTRDSMRQPGGKGGKTVAHLVTLMGKNAAQNEQATGCHRRQQLWGKLHQHIRQDVGHQKVSLFACESADEISHEKVHLALEFVEGCILGTYANSLGVIVEALDLFVSEK